MSHHRLTARRRRAVAEHDVDHRGRAVDSRRETRVQNVDAGDTILRRQIVDCAAPRDRG